VRVRVGNTCGSGSLLRVVDAVGFWLTNAHVVGTRIGREVVLESIDTSGRVSVARGRVAAAGYRSGASVDWAVVESSVPRGFDAVPRLVGGGAASRDLITVGSPRCEQPSLRRLGFSRVNAGIGYASPNAIGGQSGSGIFAGLRTVGLITWSNGRETMYQTGDALSRTMDPSWFDRMESGWELPADAVPLCDDPQACEDGFHGAVAVSTLVSHDAAEFSWRDAARAAGPLLDYLFGSVLTVAGVQQSVQSSTGE